MCRDGLAALSTAICLPAPHKQSVVFRLSDEDQAALLKLEWGGGIRANAKRKMKGYVILGDP
jgi:hypothetical protein